MRARRRLLPALAMVVPLALGGGCLGPSAAADRRTVEARPLELSGGAAELERLRFEAGFVLSSGDARFGGLSGLWLAPEGETMVAVSDRGTSWRAELRHDAAGRLVEIGDWQAIALGRLPGDADAGEDAEALAADGQRGLVVAYEGEHRLRRYPQGDLTAAPRALPVPKALAEQPGNSGLEALAGLGEGTLLALSEGLSGEEGVLGWLIGPEGTQRLSYVPAQGFVPTGADRLGDVLYVVERRFSWLGGFGTRLVALPAATAQPGAALEGEELARLERPLISENFEAVAARRTGDGRTLLYVLSDDNFNPLQRTLLLQFAVIEPSTRGLGQGVGAAHQGAERQEQQARHDRLGAEIADRPGDPR